MYDYIECKMPLPEWPSGKKVSNFQTKSFSNPCLNHYRINEDGTLFLRSIENLFEKDVGPTGVSCQELPARYSRTYHNGLIQFYEYYHHADYTIQNAYAFEIGHIEYAAKVEHGRVVSLWVISKQEPRELSNEELEEKARLYESKVEAVRREQIKNRREHPTATQKFVDTISDLINNKSAIADQSDYIRVINRIEELVKDWREQNDPWFYHE